MTLLISFADLSVVIFIIASPESFSAPLFTESDVHIWGFSSALSHFLLLYSSHRCMIYVNQMTSEQVTASYLYPDKSYFLVDWIQETMEEQNVNVTESLPVRHILISLLCHVNFLSGLLSFMSNFVLFSSLRFILKECLSELRWYCNEWGDERFIQTSVHWTSFETVAPGSTTLVYVLLNNKGSFSSVSHAIPCDFTRRCISLIWGTSPEPTLQSLTEEY